MASTSSLTHRSTLASLVSPLRRIRPRVSFRDLPAHRVPTLWYLYRGVLQLAPGENIRWRMRGLFREWRHSCSLEETRVRLSEGHQWLDKFKRAEAGDIKLQQALARYDRMIGARRDKEHWKDILIRELEWRNRLLNRPILTGSYLRPSTSNRPLPRLKPQPHAISMMIANRRKATARRMEKMKQINEAIQDIREEGKFESRLWQMGDFRPDFVGSTTSIWVEPLLERRKAINKSFDLDKERQNTPYPRELLYAIYKARIEKIANKTRERERERLGEVLPITLKRRRSRPPAHVLQTMSPERKKLSKLASGSVSEVGVVGWAKKRLGYKLKHPEWVDEEFAESGCGELVRGVHEENVRRRKVAEDRE